MADVGAVVTFWRMSFNPRPGYGVPPAPPAQFTGQQSPLLEVRPDADAFWRGVGFRALIFVPLIVLGVYRSAGRMGIGWSALLYGGLVQHQHCG